MSDTPAEIIDAVRRASETASRVRLETEDGHVVETGIDTVDLDKPLAEETPHRPPYGEFSAVLLPGGMHDIENWVIGGTILTIEQNGGGWQPVTVGWTTEVDEDGNAIDGYSGEVVAAEVVSDE
ncbi:MULTISPECIES: hypothetical protein [Halorussus]|uniref:hypothetical protein n=1 Tax=Halorussus TaxID=1070314 RepID=UPI000E219A32|nr:MULTISPECIES: hypothetical protein [Halorussus]NHN60469.1 hypothetical protein [Halorussus sp. JP-T4]